VLVYDITNLRTFESLDSWRSEFLLERRPEKPDQFPFIILGNNIQIRRHCIDFNKGTKVDQKSKRQVKIENVREWCKENGNTLYFEISGKERVTVEKAFEVIARVAAGEDLDALDPDVSSLSSTHSTVDQNLSASNSTCSLI